MKLWVWIIGGIVVFFLGAMATILVILFVAASLFSGSTPLTSANPTPSLSPALSVSPSSSPASQGITITAPQAGQAALSPLTISGSVNGNGWSGFEGQVGTVSLVGDDGVTVLAKGVLKATTDWTKLPTSFKTTLTFSPGNNIQGKLVFKNENPSGDPARDKTVSVPVVFKLPM